jgi:hypothetical protein
MREGTSKMMIEELAEGYNKAYPNYPPLRTSENWVYGMWMIGQNYRSKMSYYGEFPPSYLDRITAMLANTGVRSVLHLFSGTVEKGRFERELTIDVNADLSPDLSLDLDVEDMWPELVVEEMGELPDAVIADPPYSEEDAAHYGTCLVNRNKVVKGCARVLKRGGLLVWLDQVWPMFRKDELEMIGTVGLIRSTNHRVRCTFIWRKL